MTHNPNASRSFSALSSAAEEAFSGQDAIWRDQTPEERTVIALERIADQLALIHADLSSIDDFARGNEPVKKERESTFEGEEPLEGPGGQTVSPLPAFDPEVARTLEERFGVGGYRHTNLQHSIAEAKRAGLVSA